MRYTYIQAKGTDRPTNPSFGTSVNQTRACCLGKWQRAESLNQPEGVSCSASTALAHILSHGLRLWCGLSLLDPLTNFAELSPNSPMGQPSRTWASASASTD